MSLTLFRTAFTALRVNLLRSFLTMLGIIIGVSAVIIMVALGAGAQREVDAQIESMGGNLFILMGSFRRMGGAATAASARMADSVTSTIDANGCRQALEPKIVPRVNGRPAANPGFGDVTESAINESSLTSHFSTLETQKQVDDRNQFVRTKTAE